MRIILTIISILTAGSLAAQNSNGYLFIEPNISLKYDSALLKQKDRYTNPVYGTESYGFAYNAADRSRSSVQISTGYHLKMLISITRIAWPMPSLNK